MDHTVSDCPRRKFQGKMKDIMAMTKEALDWIATLNKEGI